MIKKDIREVIQGPDSESNKLTGKPIKPGENPKPIKLSGKLKKKYFIDTDPKRSRGL